MTSAPKSPRIFPQRKPTSLVKSRTRQSLSTFIFSSIKRSLTLWRPQLNPRFREPSRIGFLERLGLFNLLLREPILQAHHVDWITGSQKRILILEWNRGIDSNGPRKSDIGLGPFSFAGRTPLSRLERLPHTARGHNGDPFLGIHPSGQGPQQVVRGVNIDIRVHDHGETGTERTGQGGGQDVLGITFVSGSSLSHLKDDAAPVGDTHGDVGINAEARADPLGQFKETGLATDYVNVVVVIYMDDQGIINRSIFPVGNRRDRELVGAIRLSHIA